MVNLTWFIFSAAARTLAPVSRMWLFHRCSAVSVWRKWPNWRSALVVELELTRLILSASATNRAPSPPISLVHKYRVVSVWTKWRRWLCNMGVDCCAHSIDFKCIGHRSCACITYRVASQIQSGECLDQKIKVCYWIRWRTILGWFWAHRLHVSPLQYQSCCRLDPE